MRILFLSHYFPPEVNAPATRTYEHCALWAQAGHDVTVITCAPNCPDGEVYDGYKNRFRPQTEWVAGIRVVRTWTYLAANAGTVRRIVNYLSFMISATITALFVHRPHVVIATSPQFFCGWAGVFVSWLKWRPFVLEIRDIWPESIRSVGAMKNRWLLKLLERLEQWLYRRATHIVTVGEGYQANIIQKCPRLEQISVITNGVDLQRFRPRELDLRFLHMWDLEDKFVCLYAGTVGMAHGLEVVLDAAILLKRLGRDDVCFCIVGDGARRAVLEEEAQRRNVNDLVRFVGRQPKEQMPDIVASCDASLVHLKDCELFSSVIPSKIFEFMAMGCPIIMGVRGAAREIVMQAEAGVTMEPESAESLVLALEQLADNPQLVVMMRESSRTFVAEHYDRRKLAAEYLHLLCRVTKLSEQESAESMTSLPLPVTRAVDVRAMAE